MLTECVRHFKDITQAVLQQQHHGQRFVKQRPPPCARSRLSQQKDPRKFNRRPQHSKAWSLSTSRQSGLKAPASQDTSSTLAFEGPSLCGHPGKQLNFSGLERVESGRPSSATSEDDPALTDSRPGASCDKAVGTDGADVKGGQAGLTTLPGVEPGVQRVRLEPLEEQGSLVSHAETVTAAISLKKLEVACPVGATPQSASICLHLHPPVDKDGGAAPAPAATPVSEHGHHLRLEAHGAHAPRIAPGLCVECSSPRESDLALCLAGLSGGSPPCSTLPDVVAESSNDSATASASMAVLKCPSHACVPFLSPKTAILTLRQATWAHGLPPAVQAGADDPDHFNCAAEDHQYIEDSIADQHSALGQEPAQPTAASPPRFRAQEVGHLMHSVDEDQEGLGTPTQGAKCCPSTQIASSIEGPILNPSSSNIDTEVALCEPTLESNLSCNQIPAACEHAYLEGKDEHAVSGAKEHAVPGKQDAGIAATEPALQASEVDSSVLHTGVAHPRDTIRSSNSPEDAESLGGQIATLILHEDADADALRYVFTSTAVTAQRNPPTPGKERGCLLEPVRRPPGSPQLCRPAIVPATIQIVATAGQESEYRLPSAHDPILDSSNAVPGLDVLGSKAEDVAQEVCGTQMSSGLDACTFTDTGGTTLEELHVCGALPPNSTSLLEVCTFTHMDAAGQEASNSEVHIPEASSTLVLAKLLSPRSAPTPDCRRGDSAFNLPAHIPKNSLGEAPNSCEPPGSSEELAELSPSWPSDETQKLSSSDSSKSQLASELFCDEGAYKAHEVQLVPRAVAPRDTEIPSEETSISAMQIGSELRNLYTFNWATGLPSTGQDSPSCCFLQARHRADQSSAHEHVDQPERTEALIARERHGSSETADALEGLSLRTGVGAPPNQAFASPDTARAGVKGPDSQQLGWQVLEAHSSTSPCCTISGLELPQKGSEMGAMVQEMVIVGARNPDSTVHRLDATTKDTEGRGSARVGGYKKIVHEDFGGLKPACSVSVHAYLLSPASDSTSDGGALAEDERTPSSSSWQGQCTALASGSPAEPDTWSSHSSKSPVLCTCAVNAKSEPRGCRQDTLVDHLQEVMEPVDAAASSSPVSSTSATESSCSVLIGTSFLDGLPSAEYTHLWSQTSSLSVTEETLVNGRPSASEDGATASCEAADRDVMRGSPVKTDHNDTVSSTRDLEEHSYLVDATATEHVATPQQDRRQIVVFEREPPDEGAGPLPEAQSGSEYTGIRLARESHTGRAGMTIATLQVQENLTGALPMPCDIATNYKDESPRCSMQCQLGGTAAGLDSALERNARLMSVPKSHGSSMASGTTTPTAADKETNHGGMFGSEDAAVQPGPDPAEYNTTSQTTDPRTTQSAAECSICASSPVAPLAQSTLAPSNESCLPTGMAADLLINETELVLPVGPAESPTEQEVAPGPAPLYSNPSTDETSQQSRQPLLVEASQLSCEPMILERLIEHVDVLQPTEPCSQHHDQPSPDETFRDWTKPLAVVVGPNRPVETPGSTSTSALLSEERLSSAESADPGVLLGWEGLDLPLDRPQFPHLCHVDADSHAEAQALRNPDNVIRGCDENEKVQEGGEVVEAMDSSRPSTPTRDDVSSVATDAAWLEAYIERAMALYFSKQGSRPWDHVPLGTTSSLFRQHDD